jgi:uncharacterized protein YkwD
MRGTVLKIEQKQTKISLSGLERDIHSCVNDARSQHGLSLLSLEQSLCCVARGHSQDMAKRHFFNHRNPDGQDPTARGRAVGYPVRRTHGHFYTEGLAENIYMTSLYRSAVVCGANTRYDWFGQEEIARATVQGWMHSPGHRKNILTATFDREGIGVAVDTGRMEAYVTQNLI